MTLIHLGAKTIRLYQEDLNLKDYNYLGDEFYLLGRPSIPAVFAHYFHQFTE